MLGRKCSRARNFFWYNLISSLPLWSFGCCWVLVCHLWLAYNVSEYRWFSDPSPQTTSGLPRPPARPPHHQPVKEEGEATVWQIAIVKSNNGQNKEKRFHYWLLTVDYTIDHYWLGMHHNNNNIRIAQKSTISNVHSIAIVQASLISNSGSDILYT